MGMLTALGVDQISSSQAAWLFFYAWIAYTIVNWTITAIYNVYFHPLKNFPGPKSWLLFPITRQIDSIRGVREHKILEYHEKYGDVVRGAPDHLTFIAPEAWKDIYGHGHPELPKDTSSGNQVQNILNADAKTHVRYRRAMLPAFSDKALTEQEAIITKYVDLLMTRLNEIATSTTSQTTDMVTWFNYTTFDLIGDLAFGESLGGLSHNGTNVWVRRIRQSINMLPLLLTLRMYIPGLGKLLSRVFAKSQAAHEEMVQSLVRKRISKSDYDHRGDFMDQMMRSRQSGGDKSLDLSDAELAANADIMMIAGSETTATLLAGVTYLLLTHPAKLARVQSEVRAAFPTKESITFAAATAQLPYMLACLTEALRLYPPVAIVMFRHTLPNGGAPTHIAGHAVPPRTRVGVPQLACYRSPRNFARPAEFAPERWLPEALRADDEANEFAADRRDGHRPFSVGPRDCIGRNLAFHEMRIIMARLLWEFDLALAVPEGEGAGTGKGARWLDQEVRVFWDKKPLMVRVTRKEGV